jgi:hypothetical protein
MGEVMIFSYTVPFFLGTVDTIMQGKLTGIACVERSKTGFLSFHTIRPFDWIGAYFTPKCPRVHS